jgi:hypothetical protein
MASLIKGPQAEFAFSLKTHLSLSENFSKVKSEVHEGLPWINLQYILPGRKVKSYVTVLYNALSNIPINFFWGFIDPRILPP